MPMARRLPAPKQLECLTAIFQLTFEEPGSVKKFFDSLADLISSIPRPTTGPGSLMSPSAGTSSSGATLAS